MAQQQQPDRDQSAKNDLADQRTRKKEEISEKDRDSGVFKNDPDKEGETGKTSTAPNSSRH